MYNDDDFGPHGRMWEKHPWFMLFNIAVFFAGCILLIYVDYRILLGSLALLWVNNNDLEIRNGILPFFLRLRKARKAQK